MDNDIKQLDVMEEIQDEKGASLLEYALLAALIAVVCIAAITFLGEQASTTFSEVGSHLGTSAGGS